MYLPAGNIIKWKETWVEKKYGVFLLLSKVTYKRRTSQANCHKAMPPPPLWNIENNFYSFSHKWIRTGSIMRQKKKKININPYELFQSRLWSHECTVLNPKVTEDLEHSAHIKWTTFMVLFVSEVPFCMSHLISWDFDLVKSSSVVSWQFTQVSVSQWLRSCHRGCQWSLTVLNLGNNSLSNVIVILWVLHTWHGWWLWMQVWVCFPCTHAWCFWY